MTLAVGAGDAIALTTIVAVGAGAQAVTGLGFSLVSAPVFVLVLGPADGVRLVNMCSVVSSGVGAATLRRGIDVRRAAGLLLPAVVVTPLVAWVVHRTDSDLLSVLAGLVTLMSVAALAFGLRARRWRGRAGLVAAGTVSATMNTVGGLSGPAVAIYALNDGWPPELMRATFQLYFFVLNLVAVLALQPVQPGVLLGTALAVCVVAGFAAGRAAARKLDAAAVRGLVLGVAAAGGAAAILRGVL